MLMISSRVLLTLFNVVVVLNYCHSQAGDGITISLGDMVIPNHGLVTTEDIGVDRNGTNLMEGLKCSTDYSGCCSDNDITGLNSGALERVQGGRDPSGVGSWKFAHTIDYVPRQIDRPSFIAGITRNGQAVYVFRNNASDNNRLYLVDGIWRCVIPDSNGMEQTKYIGIYSNSMSSNGSLSAGSPSTIQFTMVSEDPVVFNLTFKTTGGPATYVTWTRDGVNISSSLGDNHYTPSQTVVPNVDTINGRREELYTAGLYDNILTVSGRLSGVYGVSVTNDRTTTPDSVTATNNITIIDFSHSSVSLNVARSQDLTTIAVSWTLVNSSFKEYFSSYEVMYTVCDIWSSDCGNPVSQTITDFTTTQFTVTDLTLWKNYNFSVSADFSSNPTVDHFTHILPTPISTGNQTITILGLLPPEITSVSELANITSVQVTWNQLEGGLAADEYVVSYRCLNGRDGQCSSFQDEDSLIVMANEQGGLFTTILHLQVNSSFICNVTARKGALQNTSSSLYFTTNSTVPSGAPQNLMIDSTSTSVTISWDSVECIHRNGLITHYIISYSQGRNGEINQMNVTVNITNQDKGGSYTVTGIDPTANYVFKVAAVNEDGVGVFANVTSTNQSGTSGGSATAAAVASVVILLIIAAAVILFIVLGVLYFRKHKFQGLFIKSKLGSRSEVTFLRKNDSYSAHIPGDMSDPLKNEEKHSKKQSTKKDAAGQAPVIDEFPKETQMIEGQEVYFKVVVIGYPTPKLQWYHNGKQIAEDYSTELDQNGSLHIPSSEKRHSGVYKLVATNTSGRAEKEVQLKILDEDQAPPLKDVDLSPVAVMDFGPFVSQNHKNNNAGFNDMYQALDKGDNHTTMVGLSPENKKLNRFANMTVYDDNHIVLKPSETFKGAGFINACYIDGYSIPGKFIATQGPLPHTLTDFWRLVLQEKVHTIVMVTNLKEGKKEKCHQYWPDTGSVDYGPINVAITDQQIYADYTTRSFFVKVEDSTEQPLKVTQYHFTAWPDHGVPTYATSILAFHRRIKSQHKPKRGPMLVHCSAGVGRTGTFIAIDSVQEQVKKEKIIDIAGIVNRMRHQRMKMVQTQDQFMFIHDAILENVMCGDTQVSAMDLRRTLRKMETINPSTHKSALQEQFEVLEQVSASTSESSRCITAMRHPDKNRKTDHLPTENYRVVLKGEFPDYIHATNVDGHKQKRAYIIAEGPMESTVRNFWKVVSDRKCGVVVMCSDLVENGEESSCQYWPDNGKERFGEFTVVLLDQEECPGYTIRKLSLETKKKEPQQVTQFHITNWDVDGSCSNLKSITDVIENVSIAQRRTGNHPIVVHCHDTVGRSGMFCAIMSTIERCKSEGVVDVFQVIKALRVQKPGAILNVEQYHVVFSAVLMYLDSLDTYANFQNM